MFFAGCSTLSETERNEPVSGTFENDDIKVTAVASDDEMAQFISIGLNNKTQTPIQVSFDNSTYVDGSKGLSTRFVDGDTIKINANLAQTIIPVAPGSLMSKTICSTGPGGVFMFLNGGKIYLAYSVGGVEKYAEIVLGSVNEATKNKVGTVSINKTIWHPLFTGNTKDSLHVTLQSEAEKKYGKGVTLSNIQYDAEWSPKSLLLYFSILGYVDNAKASADVLLGK
ncbi:MAG: hypothetical protein M0P35_10495 [Bacteroidales bacterium]|nr:hypothetical protein [Bacteroidales bacterium]